jgi:hypothetical protein
VGACYLDANNVVHITFNDGSGDVRAGTADVIASYCVAGTTEPTIVTISTPAATLARGAAQTFTAKVTGNANVDLVWSVDGIVGGNLTVGTIDANGNYTAGSEAGTHTISATSVADGSVVATATATVTATNSILNVNGA